MNHAISELLEELKFARAELEDWAAYASDYFRQKHDLQGILAHIDSVIEQYGKNKPWEEQLNRDLKKYE